MIRRLASIASTQQKIAAKKKVKMQDLGWHKCISTAAITEVARPPMSCHPRRRRRLAPTPSHALTGFGLQALELRNPLVVGEYKVGNDIQ